jgi:hypothetical protein
LISLKNLDGNGSFPEEGLITYSYSEDATPIDPHELTGGAGQVQATMLADESPRGSRLVINNTLTLSDDDFGVLEFTARQFEFTEGTADVTGETVLYRLNSYRSAAPHGGAGATLLTAILEYCEMVDILPSIDAALIDKLDLVPVNFVGWNGELWEHLKMLCAAVPIDDQGTLLEMVVVSNELIIREALQIEIDISEHLSSKTMRIESYESAQALDLFFYDTEYGYNRIVQEQSPAKNTFAINENVSITDTLQVNAGETIRRRVKINASLKTVNQPQPVSTITQLPFPLTGSQGEYVVVGQDDYKVDANQWLGEGGSVTVALTENPDEIEITIVAPKAVQLPTEAGEPVNVTLAPYKIGVESSGGIDYPALYITGEGVFFEKTNYRIATGASNELTAELTSTQIDNPFIITKNALYGRGIAAAQRICGPSVSINATLHTGIEFGTTVGSVISEFDTKFRISSISFDESGATVAAKSHVSFANFNQSWSGSTLSDFDTINSGLRFNEFTIIPLVKE